MQQYQGEAVHFMGCLSPRIWPVCCTIWVENLRLAVPGQT